MIDFERWGRVAHEPSPWIGRLRILAGLIVAGSAVLDIGAGSQELRALLAEGCTYQALDCIQTTPGTIVADLDGWRDWMLRFGAFDVAVLSGVLEYLAAPAACLFLASRWAGRVLCSYDHGGAVQARSASGWHNRMSRRDLRAIVRGLGLKHRIVAAWQGQSIYEIS